MDNLTLEDWMPMGPAEGPPFPRSMGIYWPWYKVAVPPVAPPEVVPAVPVVAPPVVPVIAYPPPAVIPPAAPPVIAYPPVAPPVIAYPPVAPPPPPVVPEVIYACPLCGAEFSTLSELEAHMALVHPPAPPEVPAPPATYHLYVETVGEGVVTPGSGDYPAHLPLTLIATPGPGYEFDYWGGDVSGTTPVVSLLMDRDKVVTSYFKPIEVPALPPPPPPKLPTVSISSASFTPSEATIGDVVSGTISWMPRIAQSPELFDFGISADLIDSAGRPVMNVLTAYPTAEIGVLQATPFSLDTTGLPEGRYGLQVHFSDLVTGAEIAKGRFPNLLHLLPLPEIPAPPPEVEISITGPDSAKHREKVIVSVKTTNLTEYSHLLRTRLFFDGLMILSHPDTIAGGASKTYPMMFYMPIPSAFLLATVEYQVADLWVPVGSASKTVRLEEEVPEVPEVPGLPLL